MAFDLQQFARKRLEQEQQNQALTAATPTTNRLSGTPAPTNRLSGLPKQPVPFVDPVATSAPAPTAPGYQPGPQTMLQQVASGRIAAEQQQAADPAAQVTIRTLPPVEPQLDPAAERGIIGDVGSRLARGTTGLLETSAHMVDVLTPGGSQTARDAAGYFKDLPKENQFLRPDVSEVEGKEGFVKRGIMGGVESAPLSAAVLPPALLGAQIGSTLGPAGTAVGGMVGGAIGLGGLFFAGTYGKEKEATREKLTATRADLTLDQIEQLSHKNALTKSYAEVGGEAAGDMAAYLIFSRVPGGLALYKGGKAILKELVSPNAVKSIAAAVAKDMPFEVGSEMGTSLIQNQADREIGLSDISNNEAMAEAIIPAMFLSTGMGVAFKGYDAYKRKQAYDSLNTGETEQRLEAVNQTAGILAQETDKNVAIKWQALATSFVRNGQEIPLDMNIAELATGDGNQQLEENAKLNQSVAALERQNLPTRDLIAIKNDPVQLQEAGLRPEDVDVILNRRYESLQAANQELAQQTEQAPLGLVSRVAKKSIGQEAAELTLEAERGRLSQQQAVDAGLAQSAFDSYDSEAPAAAPGQVGFDAGVGRLETEKKDREVKAQTEFFGKAEAYDERQAEQQQSDAEWLEQTKKSERYKQLTPQERHNLATTFSWFAKADRQHDAKEKERMAGVAERNSRERAEWEAYFAPEVPPRQTAAIPSRMSSAATGSVRSAAGTAGPEQAPVTPDTLRKAAVGLRLTPEQAPVTPDTLRKAAGQADPETTAPILPEMDEQGPAASPEQSAQSPGSASAPLTVAEYTAKNGKQRIIITGETAKHKSRIQGIKDVRYNHENKGYSFPIEKRAEIMEKLGDLLGKPEATPTEGENVNTETIQPAGTGAAILGSTEQAAPSQDQDERKADVDGNDGAAPALVQGNITSPDTRESWQIPKDEYVARAGSDVDAVAVAKSAHANIVKKALAAGKDVPAEVLEPYRLNRWARVALDKINQKGREGGDVAGSNDSQTFQGSKSGGMAGTAEDREQPAGQEEGVRDGAKGVQPAPTPSVPKKPDGGYQTNSFASGWIDFFNGKPRALPGYFTSPRGKNQIEWFSGWDAAKAANISMPVENKGETNDKRNNEQPEGTGSFPTGSEGNITENPANGTATEPDTDSGYNQENEGETAVTQRDGLPAGVTASPPDPFAAAGFEVDQSIVQTNKPQRTKKDSPLRLALRPEFSGEIEAGRDYILLDDAIGQGGTIAELRYFVESNGGRVVAVSALTSGIFSNKLSIRSETVAKLEEKYGREKLERFLDEFNTAGRIEALTEKEGRFILGQLSLDALRNRILADAQEANINATAWQVRSPLSEIVKRSTSLSTTPADVRAELAAHLSPEGVDDLLAAGTVRLLGSQQQAQRIIDRLKKRSVKPSIRYSKDGDIQGFTTSGKVYLVQDGISKGNSFAVLKHELGVHLRQATLNDATFQALVGSLEERQDEDSATGAAIRAAMQRVPEDTAQENYWEETLAYMVEDHPNNSLVKKFWRLIKQILRKIGVDIKSLTVDDMNDLALAAVRREAGGYIDETVKQENFNNWFGASRVVDGNGEPLVVYHGSRSFGDPDDQSSFTFKDSDVSASNTKSPGAGLGHFFAENRGDSVPFAGLSGGIFPVHLRIENPFETNSFDLPAFLTRTDAKKYRAKLSRMGYDGIYLADEAHWISFTPNQAKSADQNNGEFSRENDDVRFSKKKPSPLTASFVKGTPHTGLYKNTQAMAQLSPGAILTLTREADNVHDKNAVKIMLGTQAVGYVDKKINTKIAARMDAGERLQSRISKISGRPDAPRFTVLIGSSDAMAASPPAGSKDQSRPQPAAARRPSPRRHGQAAIDTLLLNVLGADKMAIMQDIRKNGLTAANEQELLTAEVAPEAPDDAGKTRELWKAQLFAAPKAIARKSLSLLTLRQLREIYRDVKPVENFYQATRETAADTTKLMGEADKVYEKWSKLDTKNADAMSMLMSEATVASVSPDVPFESRLDIDEAREKMEESADALVTLRNSTENVDAKVKWHEDRIRRLAGEIKDEQKRFSEHKRLSAKYEGLSKEAKAVYQEVRKMYDANLGRVRDGLLDRLNRSPMSETSKKMAMDSIRLKFETYLRNGPYFPLSRFGEYIVQITDADGNYERHEFDFIGQRDRAVARWSAEKDATGEPRWTIRQKTSKEYSPEADGASSQFVTDFAKIIDSSTLKAGEKSVLIDELNQLFIKSMPDMSHRKHFAHRKKVEGYSRDQIRAFASHMQHAAHHIARIRHADKMTQALSDLNEIVQTSDGNADLTHITDLFNELNKRHQILLNPKISPIAQALTSFGFIWNIGPSIASALVNMSQTPLVAFPMLGTRFNDGRGAFMELRQASAQYFGSPFVGSKGFDMSQNKKLSENARAMLATLEDDGTIDTSMALSLAQATSADLLNLAQTKNGGQMLKVMRVVSYPFHVTEVANRQITAVAAYELAIKHGKTHEEAISEAREVVLDSHFDYSQANRARFMEGNVQRVLFLFKQYSQQMSFLLGRSFHQAVKGESQAVKVQARKQLLGIVGGHFLVSGAFGMPVVGGIAEVLEFFVNALGDDDEPWDWESALRNMLADTVGKDAGEAIAHGPWRALPGLGELDIASRVSLGDLWFRTPEREMEGKDAWNQYINMALGPLASNGASMAQGLSAMSEGEVARGVEMMLPKAIKDAMKTIRYAREGVTSWNDATLIDELNTVEMFGQMLGFSPARINEMYEGKNAIKNLETKLDNRKQHLVNGWVEATRAGDVETANRIMKDMVQFTKKNPAFAITRQGLRQSMRMREKVQAQTKNGVYMPAKRAELLEEGRFSNI